MNGLSLVMEAGHVIAKLDPAMSDGCRAAVHDAKRCYSFPPTGLTALRETKPGRIGQKTRCSKPGAQRSGLNNGRAGSVRASSPKAMGEFIVEGWLLSLGWVATAARNDPWRRRDGSNIGIRLVSLNPSPADRIGSAPGFP
jgi:hypothetical protein